MQGYASQEAGKGYPDKTTGKTYASSRQAQQYAVKENVFRKNAMIQQARQTKDGCRICVRVKTSAQSKGRCTKVLAQDKMQGVQAEQ